MAKPTRPPVTAPSRRAAGLGAAQWRSWNLDITPAIAAAEATVTPAIAARTGTAPGSLGPSEVLKRRGRLRTWRRGRARAGSSRSVDGGEAEPASGDTFSRAPAAAAA